MAKGQMRSTREKKKPKQDKNKMKSTPAASAFAALPPGKSGPPQGQKK